MPLNLKRFGDNLSVVAWIPAIVALFCENGFL